MMKFLLSLLLASTAVTAVDTDIAENRELFIDETCGAALEGLIGEGTTCSCDLSIFNPISVKSKCSGTQTCVIGEATCGTPSVTVDFNFQRFFQLALPLTLDLCFDKVLLLGFNVVNPVCISFGDQNISILGFNFFQFFFDILTGGDRVFSSDMRSSSTPDTCEMKVGDDICLSCSTCEMEDGSSGVTYDCSSLVEGLVASTCSEVGILPVSFADAAKVDTLKFPITDDAAEVVATLEFTSIEVNPGNLP